MSTLVEGPLFDGRGVAAESLPSVLVVGAASERIGSLEDVILKAVLDDCKTSSQV